MVMVNMVNSMDHGSWICAPYEGNRVTQHGSHTPGERLRFSYNLCTWEKKVLLGKQRHALDHMDLSEVFIP